MKGLILTRPSRIASPIGRRSFVAGLMVAGMAPWPQPSLATQALNVVDGFNGLGHEVFTRCFDRMDENVAISPLSLGLCTAIAATGAEGTTASDFETALDLPHGACAALAEAAKALAHALGTTSGLSLANALAMTGDGDLLRREYVARVKSAFDAEVITNASAARVNAWVAGKTNGKITDLLDTIGDLTLVNGLFFRAGWQTPADKSETDTGAFTTARGKVVSLPRMVMRHITCVQRPGLQTFLLPYQDNATAMLLALPDKGVGLSDAAKMLGPLPLREVLGAHGSANGGDVLLLPRFRTSFKRDMKDTFSQIGLGGMFDAERANFGSMSAVRPSLYVSGVAHQTVVDVDEAGTTAAAATAATMLVPSAVAAVPTIYVIDRPFLFNIVHRATGTVLVQGAVNKPL